LIDIFDKPEHFYKSFRFAVAQRYLGGAVPFRAAQQRLANIMGQIL
jgi:hypothetical protein